MNLFDIVVTLGLLFAVVTGFTTGLLRSAVTILAYLVAMPLAVALLAMVGPHIAMLPSSPFPPNGVLLFGLFLLIGVILGKMARTMLDDTIGSEIGIGDRLGGALLGAIRVGLVVTTLVLVFDQLVPPAKQPQFLTDPSCGRGSPPPDRPDSGRCRPKPPWRSSGCGASSAFRA